ncbi:2OG-Fe(II) oxygenase [Streptomyces sp. NPDC020192]|uniref:2OG-Fe(II) oxygenase n=1 Tax=Streptomyces sp. NPDC020192 TaxID=3365066 RepID=UPI003798FAFE
MAATIIDMARLAASSPATDPYPHVVCAETFTPGSCEAISAGFPATGFHYDVRMENSEGKKQYRAHNMQLVDGGTPVPGNIARLSGVWRRLLDEITGAGYRGVVQQLMGIDLTQAVLDIRLVRYDQDDWIEPHVDRPDKLVTHLFYLNERWQPEWSGALRLLRGPDIDDCAVEVFPRMGTSVLMARTQDAWHAVPPITGEHSRKLFLAHFVAPPAVRGAS